ncbi:MAG: MFS transporter [Candidatus Heimdallarchaeota archaeon]|nr:MFS transporter [Candidatus Heimdallarchaeota archaeon]MCK4612294.1 MFS transporter [Candidatus Heimdallarchaeota archaeon]
MEPNDKSETKFIDERLPLKSKFAYGFTNSANGMLSGLAISGALTLFYNVKLGLSAELVAIVWLVFAIWNAINDPLFGILQERTNTKIGRRIPYLRYGAPIYVLTFIFCWYPFSGTSHAAIFWNIPDWSSISNAPQMVLFWNMLFVLFLVDSLYTMIGLITYTLPAEMTLTQQGRSNLSVYSIYLGALGLIVAMVIPLILLDSEPGVIHPFFRPAMIIVGIVAGTIMFVASFFLVENEYARTEEPLGFIKSIVETVKNREFLVFEVSNFFYILAYTTLTGAIYYFVPYVLGFSGLMASLPLVLVFVMVFGFSVLANHYVKKYGLKKVYIVGLISSSVVFLLLLAVGKFTIPSLIVLAILGMGFAPVALINGPLMGDVIDNDELLTGKRRETTYAGMNALVTKPAISIANAVFLAIISAFGFDNEIATQTSQTQFGIVLGFTLIPAISLILSALALKWYRLDGPDWFEKKKKLNAIHLQKEQEYIAQLRKEGKISATYQKLYKDEPESTK